MRTIALLLGLILLVVSVRPAFADTDLIIVTVPALEGARFEIDGEMFVADENGVVRTQVPERGTYSLKALDFETKDPRVRAEFQRWCCVVDTKTPEVEVPVGGSAREVQAGYELSYLIDAEFRDPEGRAVDRSVIESLQIKNDKGLRFELAGWTPQWLLGLDTTRVHAGLVPTEVRYRLEEVRVSSSNVVNAGQQALLPAEDSLWEIDLLFYDVTVTSTDYLYGNTAGSSVLLVFPDGQRRTFDLSNGTVSIDSLPRGDYEIGIKGTGITLMQPLKLSRDQEVSLDFISYADLLTGVTVGVAAVVLLILIGRPHIGTLVLRKAAAVRSVFSER